MVKGYIAVALNEEFKATLVANYPFFYGREYCHHVTLSFGDGSSEELERQMNFFAMTSKEVSVVVEDNYNDGEGVECFTININGHTLRADGGRLHLTHSLADGRRPVESNAVVTNSACRRSRVAMIVKGTIVAIEH